MKTFKAANYQAKCLECGHESIMPRLHEHAYGEFLGVSANGRHVYVNSFEAEADAFFEAFKENEQFAGLDEATRAFVVQHAVGALFLDPDEHGAPYSITARLRCQQCCGSLIALSLIESGPQKFAEIPYGTCCKWTGMDTCQRLNAIGREVADYPAGPSS